MRTCSLLTLASFLVLSTAACGSEGGATIPDASQGAGGGSAQGSQTSGGGQTTKVDSPTGCAFVAAPPVAPDADPSADPAVYATATSLQTMDRLIGPYLRGEVAVYRGTMKAHDNASALANVAVYGPRPDGDIALGPALARVEVHVASTGDWGPPKSAISGNLASLVLRSVATGDHVVLSQLDTDATTTLATLVGKDREFVTLTSSCTGCMADLAAKPANLALSGLTTTGTTTSFQGYAGQGGQDVAVTVHTTVSADLTKVAACDLRFEDLVAANVITGPNESHAGLENAIDTGTELVWHETGSIGGPGGHTCADITAYTIDRFVKKSDLGVYGARNFVLGATTQICAPTP
jgi:hypothetical protein